MSTDPNRKELDETREESLNSSKRADAALAELDRLGGVLNDQEGARSEVETKSRSADDGRRKADDDRRAADDDRRGADDVRRAADDDRRKGNPLPEDEVIPPA